MLIANVIEGLRMVQKSQYAVRYLHGVRVVGGALTARIIREGVAPQVLQPGAPLAGVACQFSPALSDQEAPEQDLNA